MSSARLNGKQANPLKLKLRRRKMYKLPILYLLLMAILSGCLRHNNCYEQCYATMKVMSGPFDGKVEYFGTSDELEKLRNESFSDCIIVGKSHFSGPPVSLKVIKRFAAMKGANVILWRWKPERAGLQHECQCNPIGSHDVEIEDTPDENMVEFTSKSVSVRGSAASGPGATVIYAHRIWFLYRNERKQ